jgi:NAD(P)-dependent dehydrogenase (short-subunit alcohol dehydrogenase family)/acyl carrier protein
VIGNGDALALALVEHLRRLWPGRAIVRVDQASSCAKVSALHHAVRAGERADNEAMLRQVQAAFGTVSQIHHLGGIDAELPTDADAALERGFFGLLALVQALDTTMASGERKLRLQVVVNQMEDVSGTEALCAEKATVFSLCKVIGQEYPQIDCRVADVVLPAAHDAQARLIEQLAALAYADPGEPRVALRGPHRWVRGYEPLAVSEGCAVQRFRPRGVYLITGGLGGVGMAVARHLAQAWQARLVLLGRSYLPARAEWERIAADADEAEALRTKLRLLLELEALGAEVLVLSADVADAAQMRSVAEQARERFGAVHGAIHAAGHAHSGMIGQRTRVMVDAVLAPKLQGTRCLLEALRDEPLDFVLLCSSISSMAGGLGMSDYAAANAYLDAIAALWQRSARFPVISVNWDAWRDLGMAAGRVLPEGIGMDGPEGARALERIVNGPAFAQVVISTTDLEQRLGQLDNGMLSLVESGSAVQVRRRTHPRPPLSTAYAAPDGELEQGLVGLWQEMLGIAGVGVEDNLFELGGDSLLAIQILARARRAYEVELHPSAFFKAPTIRDLAVLVETRLIEEIESAA